MGKIGGILPSKAIAHSQKDCDQSTVNGSEDVILVKIWVIKTTPLN